MRYAHHQHHILVQAIKRGEGARARALAAEHTEAARQNMYMAVASREQAASLVPGIRLVTEPGPAATAGPLPGHCRATAGPSAGLSAGPSAGLFAGLFA